MINFIKVIIDFFNQIVEASGEQESISPPPIPRYVISRARLGRELRDLGIDIAFSRHRDSFYFYTDMAHWKQIIKDVCKDMPKYRLSKVFTEFQEEMEVTKEKGWDFDCDNFGELARTRVAERYGLNTIASVDGNSPMGYHNFNMFRDVYGWHILEPQNKEIDPSGYKPDEALI